MPTRRKKPADPHGKINLGVPYPEGANTGSAVFQFKIQLKHTESPVWRRVLVPDDWSFSGLHAVIQAAFEWKDRRLHNFTFGNLLRIESEQELKALSVISPKTTVRCENMTEMADVFAEYERGLYTYDFEENWEHEVVFEKVLPREPATIYPCCIKVKGNAPADGTYETVASSIDDINIRLAVLMPKYRKFLYRNPFEWRLYSCLNKQKMLHLRAMAKYHSIPQWHKMDKETLITALPKGILDSIGDFIKTNQEKPDPDKLLCYLLARHHSEIPFELERFQECFPSEEALFRIIDKLKIAGYVYDLSNLDPKQLPAVMQDAPDDFYPVLIMPAEVRQRCLAVINELDLDHNYRMAACRE